MSGNSERPSKKVIKFRYKFPSELLKDINELIKRDYWIRDEEDDKEVS